MLEHPHIQFRTSRPIPSLSFRTSSNNNTYILYQIGRSRHGFLHHGSRVEYINYRAQSGRYLVAHPLAGGLVLAEDNIRG
jgi:hypothetical protein